MDNINNKKIFKPKRPKFKRIEDTKSNNYYIPMTEENIKLKNIDIPIDNEDYLINNKSIKNGKNRIIAKENKIKNKKNFNKIKKALKNIIYKINSPSKKIKKLFQKWIIITSRYNNNKNKVRNNQNYGDSEEEEEEEEENNKNNKEIYKLKKVKRLYNHNNNNINLLDEDSEEEEDDENMKLMKDLNTNNLEEIEERPPNEEESGITSILAKSMKGNININIIVALRKIFKYKSIFYKYFYKWQKVTSNPEIIIIFQYLKKMKYLILKLENKRNRLKLKRHLLNWKTNSEKMKNEKNTRKKIKKIIYKAKDGEIERKEKSSKEKITISNNNNIDNSEEKKERVKIIKKIKKKINLKLKNSTNLTDANNIINISPVKEKNPIILSQNITINENGKIENMGNDGLKHKNEEKKSKTKKIIKKVKKIVKKDKNADFEKNKEINKTEIEDSSSLLNSSNQFKLNNPINFKEKNDDKKNEIEENKIFFSDKKAKFKKMLQNYHKDKIRNKSLDMQQPKDKRFRIKNLFPSLSKSNSIDYYKIFEINKKNMKSECNNSSEENIKNKEEKIITKNKSKNKLNNNEEEITNINLNAEHEILEILNLDLIDESNEETNNPNITENIIKEENKENTTKNKERNFKENDEKYKKEINGKLYNKDEMKMYKIFNRAFHLLRKCIRSFKKRKRRKKINYNNSLSDYFNKWKNCSLNKYILEDKIKEKNNNFIISKDKYKTEINLNQNKINENKNLPIYKGKIINKEKMNKNNKIIKKHIIKNENNFYYYKSKKDKSLNNLDELSKSNYKVQNEINDIIKNTDEKIFSKVCVDNYIQFLEKTKKNIIAYKIFLKYVNNQESQYNYKQNPKKFYFNYWHKNINK